jgi:hypothetical protein
MEVFSIVMICLRLTILIKCMEVFTLPNMTLARGVERIHDLMLARVQQTGKRWLRAPSLPSMSLMLLRALLNQLHSLAILPLAHCQ